MDMCLHVVGRGGGQAQFVRHEPPRASSNLSPLLDWVKAHLNQPLDVGTLAARAGTSPRTFARRFRAQTGTTPLQWLLSARIRRAQELLETTSRSIDDIAWSTGFEAPVTFRSRFHQVVGLSPKSYRLRFRAASGAAGS